MLPESKPRVQTAARTIAILNAVSNAGVDGMAGKDIASKLGLSRQVVYHIIHTLVQLQMLRKANGANYVLGLGMATLAHGFRKQMSVSDHLVRLTQDVGRELGETAYVSGWIDDEIVVLATTPGDSAIHAAQIPYGTASNAHARAGGKLLLAMSSQIDMSNYLMKHPFMRCTPNTIIDDKSFISEIEEVQKKWVGYDREEFVLGLTCMAVPIGPAPSKLALAISAPSDRFRINHDRYLAIMRKIANSSAH